MKGKINESKTYIGDSGHGEDCSVLRESEFEKSGERKHCWADRVLPEEPPLQYIRTGFYDVRNRNLARYLGTDFETS